MDYEQLRVVDLRELLRERGLRVSGTKAELIERLKSSPRPSSVSPFTPAPAPTPAFQFIPASVGGGGREEKKRPIRGRIRIGQKHKRGVAGDHDASMNNYKNIDVTSNSRNKVNGVAANTLSPMKVGPVIDQQGLRALIFESYWQFSKLWPRAGHIQPGTECQPTEEWKRFRAKGFQEKKGRRRPLPVKIYGHATCAIYNNKVYSGPSGYVLSRKEIYVPVYKSLIENLPIIRELRKLVEQGENVMIIDHDGPPKSLYPQGLELTPENWSRMINESKFPFGHGYVVAALVAGLEIPRTTVSSPSPEPKVTSINLLEENIIKLVPSPKELHNLILSYIPPLTKLFYQYNLQWSLETNFSHFVVEFITPMIPSYEIMGHGLQVISANRNITLEYITSYPEIKWNIESLSSNPNLTVEYIRAHPEIDWNWQLLAQNPNIPNEFVRQNLPPSWNRYRETIEWIMKDKPPRSYHTIGSISWNWEKLLAQNPQVIKEIVYQISQMRWQWDVLIESIREKAWLLYQSNIFDLLVRPILPLPKDLYSLVLSYLT